MFHLVTSGNICTHMCSITSGGCGTEIGIETFLVLWLKRSQKSERSGALCWKWMGSRHFDVLLAEWTGLKDACYWSYCEQIICAFFNFLILFTSLFFIKMSKLFWWNVRLLSCDLNLPLIAIDFKLTFCLIQIDNTFFFPIIRFIQTYVIRKKRSIATSISSPII